MRCNVISRYVYVKIIRLCELGKKRWILSSKMNSIVQWSSLVNGTLNEIMFENVWTTNFLLANRGNKFQCNIYQFMNKSINSNLMLKLNLLKIHTFWRIQIIFYWIKWNKSKELQIFRFSVFHCIKKAKFWMITKICKNVHYVKLMFVKNVCKFTGKC